MRRGEPYGVVRRVGELSEVAGQGEDALLAHLTGEEHLLEEHADGELGQAYHHE